MSQPNSDESEFAPFFRESQTSFKRLPERPAQGSEMVTRSAVFAIGAGLLDYLASRQIGSLDRSGIRDEISVLLAAVAGAFIGRLRDARSLCATEPAKRTQAKFNVAAAGAGGAVGGASIAAIIPAATVTGLGFPIVSALAAIVLGGAVLAGGATAIYHILTKGKYCPHCGARGNCNQRVCRSCKRLFFPEAVEIDCSKNLFLDWYTIASYFDAQKLSYLDAEALVKENLGKWKLYPDDEGHSVFIDCERFKEWVSENKSVIASFKGRGLKDLSNAQAEDYLDSKRL